MLSSIRIYATPSRLAAQRPSPQPRAARAIGRGSQGPLSSASQRFFWACFCFSAHVFLCTATSECMAAARSACPIAS